MIAAVPVAPITGPAAEEHGAAAPASASSELVHPVERVGTRQRAPNLRIISTRDDAWSTPRGDPVAAGSPTSHPLRRQASICRAYLGQFPTMTLVVDIRHWLNESGLLPTDNLRLRRVALRIATLIEYGGPMEQLEGRMTMVELRDSS